MRAGRTQAEADAEALVAIDRRLATAQQMSQLTELQRAVAAAKEAVPARESELAAAQKQVADFAATLPKGVERQSGQRKITPPPVLEGSPRPSTPNRPKSHSNRRRREIVGVGPSKSARRRRPRRSCTK